jgi:hypothetical protein
LSDIHSVIEIHEGGTIRIVNTAGFPSSWRLTGPSLVDDDGCQKPAKLTGALLQRIQGATPGTLIPYRTLYDGTLAVDRGRSVTLERVARLEEFARWVAELDDPDGPGYEARRTVTMSQIIGRARQALGITEED